MIRTTVIVIGGAGFAWMMAFLTTSTFREAGSIKSRGMSYFLCVVFVFVGSVIWGSMAPETVYPGDEIGSTGRVATEYSRGVSYEERHRIAEKTFFLTILPALIGVRMGLGRNRRDEK